MAKVTGHQKFEVDVILKYSMTYIIPKYPGLVTVLTYTVELYVDRNTLSTPIIIIVL